MYKNIFKIVTIFVLLSCFNCTHAKTDLVFTADNIMGFWFNEEGTSIIAIQKDTKTDTYFGKIVWLKEPKAEDGKLKRDKKNPDLALRKRGLLRLEVLNGFKYAKRNKWDEGYIYDPESGNTYSCVIKMKKRDQLNVRGYIGISLFGRTTVWTKVTPKQAKELLSQ